MVDTLPGVIWTALPDGHVDFFNQRWCEYTVLKKLVVARGTWPAIVGFTAGCSLGALLEAVIGPWSFALPIGFAFLALAL